MAAGIIRTGRAHSAAKGFVTIHGPAVKRDRFNMQKILIGVLALGTIALAVVCVIQSKQWRASREQVRVAEEARQAEAEAQQTQTTRVKELERANQRLEQQVEK